MPANSDTVAEESRSNLMPPIEAQRLRNAVHERVFGRTADPIRIGRHTVLKRIGSGGMGVVYAAYDTELDRKIAVKLLVRDHLEDATRWRERLRREAQALAKLSHPNVVQLYDVGEQDGRVYLSMEFIDGPNLREWTEAQPRPWRKILEAYTQAGRGLAAAHAAGIVHRDFKPENALVGDEDRVRVLDFGLAHGRTAAVETLPPTDSSSGALLTPLTQAGLIMGTPAYMAPEQHAGAATDARSDQFSFCVALYEALYGERPFPGRSIGALRLAIVEGTVRPAPRDARVPAWVRRVLLRGLSIDPDDRFASMEALLAELGKDPAALARRIGIGVAAVLVLAGAAWLWQEREELHAAKQSELEAEAGVERKRAEDAQQELIDRADALTLREAAALLQTDPTAAMAKLKLLSPGADHWATTARMLAADADYRGVAEKTLVLPVGSVPTALSPDGVHAITRDPDAGTVTLLRTETGEGETIGVAEEGLPVVAFSPDGASFVAQRLPKGLRRWTVAGGDVTDLGSVPDTHHAAFFAGDDIVTYGRHPEVHRWHAGERSVLPGHEGGVSAVAVDVERGLTATVDAYGQLRIWDGATGEATPATGRSPIALSPEGVLASIVGPADVQLLDPRAPGEVRVIPGEDVPVEAFDFSPDGSRLAAGLADGTVAVFDVASGERQVLHGHTDEVVAVKFEGDALLVSTSLDNTLALWNLATGRAQVLRGHGGVGFWAVRPATRTVVTMGHEGTIRTWTMREEGARALEAHVEPVTAIVHTADGLLVTGSSDGSVYGWPAGAGKGTALREAGARPVAALAVDPTRRRIAVADKGGRVQLLTLGGGEPRTIAERPGEVRAVAFAADGDRIALADPGGGVRILDGRGKGEDQVIRHGNFAVRDLRFVADGSALHVIGWTRDGSNSVRVWDIATGQEQRRIDFGRSGVLAVAFSGDDRFVAFTTFDRAVHVWDAQTGGTRQLGRHNGLVMGAAFAPDARTLVTAGHDGVVKLWHVESGQSRALDLSDHRLNAVAFAPDGATFVAAGDERIAFSGRDDLPRDASTLRDWVQSATDLTADTDVGLR